MRVRIKFSKHSPMQYIGHLDTMRFFQKVIRRAGIPASFSEGFSPHILMSFASPLGVGKTSDGEYFDLDMAVRMSCREIACRLQEQMTPGFRIRAVSEIEEKKKNNGMRMIAAASYLVYAKEPVPVSEERVRVFLNRDTLPVLRKTKTREEITDIRPWIFSLAPENEGLFMLLSAGSVHNLKPELVFSAYASEQETDPGDLHLYVHRTELYAAPEDGTETFIPLLDCGCVDPSGVYRE